MQTLQCSIGECFCLLSTLTDALSAAAPRPQDPPSRYFVAQVVNATHMSLRFENAGNSTCAFYLGRIQPDGTPTDSWTVFAEGMDAM